MKLGLWRKAATSTLLPALPGQWGIASWLIYPEPVGWLARGVVFSLHRQRLAVYAVVQLLAVPARHWSGNSVELDEPGTYRAEPADLDQACETMREVADLVVAKAIPFFATHATLDGHLAFLQQQVRVLDERLGDGGWQDVFTDEQLTYVHLLRGDLDAAITAANWANKAARLDPTPNALQANQRVQQMIAAARRDQQEALALLHAQAAQSCQTLKLSPLETDQPPSAT